MIRMALAEERKPRRVPLSDILGRHNEDYRTAALMVYVHSNGAKFILLGYSRELHSLCIPGGTRNNNQDRDGGSIYTAAREYLEETRQDTNGGDIEISMIDAVDCIA